MDGTAAKSRSAEDSRGREENFEGVKKTLEGVDIISPLATASDDTLLFRPTTGGGAADVAPNSPGEKVKMFLEEAVPGLTFSGRSRPMK